MSTDDREFRHKSRVAYREMCKESNAQGMGNLTALAAFFGGGALVLSLTGHIWIAAGAAILLAYLGYWFGKKLAPLLYVLLFVGFVAWVALGHEQAAPSENNPPQPVVQEPDKTSP